MSFFVAPDIEQEVLFTEAEVLGVMARLGWSETDSENYAGVARAVAHALAYGRKYDLPALQPTDNQKYSIRASHLKTRV